MTLLIGDKAVYSGDTNIIDPHGTIAPSSHTNLSVFFGNNNHYGWHDANLLLDFLQNHIRSLWSIQMDQVIILSLVKDSLGEFLSANLALHSSPKISRNFMTILSDDFILEPFLKTEKMHKLQTLARIESHVLDLILWDMIQVAILAEFLRIMTVLILVRKLLGWALVLIVVANISKGILLTGCVVFVNFYLSDSVLNSTNFDQILLEHSVASLGSTIFVLKGPNYEIAMSGWVAGLVRIRDLIVIQSILSFLYCQESLLVLVSLVFRQFGYQDLIATATEFNGRLYLEFHHVV